MLQAEKSGYGIDEMVHMWLLDLTGWGHWWIHRQVGVTLLYMHEAVPALRGKQMVMMPLDDITVITLM